MAAATARQIPVTESDLEGGGGGMYNDLEVPGDYELVLTSVEDYDKRSIGKSYGWLFTYAVDTGKGGSVDFRIYLSFNKDARWKLLQVLQAHDLPVEEGLNDVDPNSLVGDKIGGSIDFPRTDDGEPSSKYRDVNTFFSLASPPEVEETVVESIVEAKTAQEEDLVPFGEEVAVI